MPKVSNKTGRAKGIPDLNVIPDKDCPDWFWVQSRSRKWLNHLVDIAYQDEPWVTPYEACSCEGYTINLYTMNKTCDHIRSVRKFRKEIMKNILIKKVARLSLCPCGYPFFGAHIELGHEYRVPRYNARGVSDSFTCGGCGKQNEIHLIMVLMDENKIEWLPWEVFDWNPPLLQGPEARIEEESEGITNPS